MPVDHAPTTPVTARPRPGTVSWLDLVTPDVEGASRFYAALLGWTFEDVDTPSGPYRVARAGGHEIGGVMPPDADAPAQPAWTVCVEVVSPDAVAAAVPAAGGAVIQEPTDLPGGGRLAVVADPAGAVLAVITSAPGAEALQRGMPGGLYWTEVLSRDARAARDFYPAVLGWEAVIDPGGYTGFRCAGEPVAGLMAMPERVPEVAPSHWFVSFAVPDLESALAVVAELGGVVDQPPLDLQDGRFAVVEDPQGAVFGLVAPRSGGSG